MAERLESSDHSISKLFCFHSACKSARMEMSFVLQKKMPCRKQSILAKPVSQKRLHAKLA